MHTHLSRFVLDLYELAQRISPQTFHVEAYALAQSVIAFDSAGMMSFFPTADGTLRLTAMLPFRTHPDKIRLRAELLGDERLDVTHGYTGRDPLLALAIREHGQTHVIRVAEVADPAVVEYGRLTDTAHSAALVFKHDSGRLDVCTLWRARPEAHFTETERTTADELMRHLHKAVSINRRLHGTPLTGQSKELQVVAGRSGLIHHIDNDALLLLRKEYPDWLSRFLPVDLTEALTTEGRRFHAGRYLEVQARPLDELLILDLTPRDNAERLTWAEMRVVEMIVEHDTYKATARAIGVSPATVRNQLHVIYSKLGIKTKSELIRQFGKTAQKG